MCVYATVAESVGFAILNLKMDLDIWTSPRAESHATSCVVTAALPLSCPLPSFFFITLLTLHTPQCTHFTMRRCLSDGRSCMALHRLFCTSAAWLSRDLFVPPALPLSPLPRLPLGLPLATGQKKTPPIIRRGRLRKRSCCLCNSRWTSRSALYQAKKKNGWTRCRTTSQVCWRRDSCGHRTLPAA